MQYIKLIQEDDMYIKVKYFRLYGILPDRSVNLNETNPELDKLINLPVKNGGMCYDLDSKLRKAVTKAKDEFDECRKKFAKECSFTNEIEFASGRKETTNYKIVPISLFIEQQKALFPDGIPEEMKSYFEQLEALLAEFLTDQQRETVIVKVNGVNPIAISMLTNQYDIKDLPAFTTKLNDLLQEEITLNCYQIKMSKLEKEECCAGLKPSLLEEFILDDRG